MVREKRSDSVCKNRSMIQSWPLDRKCMSYFLPQNPRKIFPLFTSLHPLKFLRADSESCWPFFFTGDKNSWHVRPLPQQMGAPEMSRASVKHPHSHGSCSTIAVCIHSQEPCTSLTGYTHLSYLNMNNTLHSRNRQDINNRALEKVRFSSADGADDVKRWQLRQRQTMAGCVCVCRWEAAWLTYLCRESTQGRRHETKKKEKACEFSNQIFLTQYQ